MARAEGRVVTLRRFEFHRFETTLLLISVLMRDEMIHHVHHVPGRLRIRIPGLKRNLEEARILTKALSRVSGVQSVEANLLTGSLLVHYDPSVSNAAAVLSAVGMDRAGEEPSQTSSTRFQEKMADAMLWYALEKAVPLVISALL
jgi:copper chaperone CopZ